MNPLSRVRPNAVIHFNDVTKAMTSRPALAIKIAECIAEYAEVEFELGSALGALLGSETKAALAMYVGATGRAAQLAMIDSAAAAALTPSHYEVFSVVIVGAVKPAMKDRDKLAHWCWGYSPDLPKALFIMEPTSKTVNLGAYFLMPDEPIKLDRDSIYVVTERDLSRMLKRIREARRLMRRFISTVWRGNSDEKRDQFLQELSAEPLVREAICRLRPPGKTSQPAQPQPRKRGRRAKP